MSEESAIKEERRYVVDFLRASARSMKLLGIESMAIRAEALENAARDISLRIHITAASDTKGKGSP